MKPKAESVVQSFKDRNAQEMTCDERVCIAIDI